jgi:hypothetical protein
MKKYLVPLLLILNTQVFAQFKLSGKINHYNGTPELKVNIPVVFGFFYQNSIIVPLAKNGTFSITLPTTTQRFASLAFQGSLYTLFITAKKNLIIELDQNNKDIKLIGGSALAENSLMTKTKFDEPPFFLLTDTYTGLNATALANQVLKPFLAARDKKIAMVNQSAINALDKKLINAEIKYLTYNNLYELTDAGAGTPATLNKFISGIYDYVEIKPDVFPAGPQYYMFANNYLRYRESKNNKGRANSLLSRWESAVKYLPSAVAEQFGYQLITRAFYDGDGAQTKALSMAYLKKFPAGIYAADVRKKSASVK